MPDRQINRYTTKGTYFWNDLLLRPSHSSLPFPDVCTFFRYDFLKYLPVLPPPSHALQQDLRSQNPEPVSTWRCVWLFMSGSANSPLSDSIPGIFTFPGQRLRHAPPDILHAPPCTNRFQAFCSKSACLQGTGLVAGDTLLPFSIPKNQKSLEMFFQ